MSRSAQICLVSPGHLGSNPRLVKEADSLVDAGYRVHVIAGDAHPDTRFRDTDILEKAQWTSEIVKLRPSRLVYLKRRLKQEICRSLFASGARTLPIAQCAQNPLVPSLMAAASNFPADFYIGHCLAALPAVVAAGNKHRARIGFDAEDFHSGEAEKGARGDLDNAIAAKLEAGLLAQCHHLTASSPLIAETYRSCHAVNPTPLLNVFPLAEAVEPQGVRHNPSFYWFSQTIGPGRGLEEFIAILSLMKGAVRLDLRGHSTESYRRQLQARASGAPIELRFLEPDVSQAMVRDAAGYSAGLGLELRHPLNRDLCLSNKAFTYLLAGVPVILSRTKAQERLALELGKACLLIDLEDREGAARKLEEWLLNSTGQQKAHAKAFQLGRERFNWDREKRIFLEQVEKVLSRPQAISRARSRGRK
jgi:glycosyltransferase involved in cell wall biosynthesis